MDPDPFSVHRIGYKKINIIILANMFFNSFFAVTVCPRSLSYTRNLRFAFTVLQDPRSLTLIINNTIYTYLYYNCKKSKYNFLDFFISIFISQPLGICSAYIWVRSITRHKKIDKRGITKDNTVILFMGPTNPQK